MLVSEATAVARSRGSVVPDGIVTSVKRATGATGAEVAAEIGALPAVPLVAFVSVDSLPRSEVGKVLRRELVASYGERS